MQRLEGITLLHQNIINLLSHVQEEEEQLLAGPKEESRTTEAMRKFVQEEEEKLFLERGPLRIKVQAAGKEAFGMRSQDCLTSSFWSSSLASSFNWLLGSDHHHRNDC